MTRLKIAIIGGGLAGMSAALALRQHLPDADVTLFETKRLPGGRAGSFHDSTTGEQVDYCQHVAMGCCTNLLNMLDNLELSHALVRYRRLYFFHREHSPSLFTKSDYLPAPLHFLPSLVRMTYLSWRQKFEIATATLVMMRSKPSQLQHTTAGEWLARYGQSQETIRDYWNVVIASALGESCQQVSMAATRKVFVDGFLASPDASDLLVPKHSLATLFGVEVPQRLTLRGVSFVTSAKVRSVSVATDQSMRVLCDKESKVFDHVILAVPWHAIAKVLDPETADAAGWAADSYANIPTSPITGIHLWFDRPIMSQPHAVFVGTLTQWVFLRQADEQGDGPEQHYVQVVISASHGLRQMGAEQLIEQVVAELKNQFPTANQSRLIRGRVVTDPKSVFSLSPEVDALRPGSRTKLPRLHLAGDFVQTGWPATMEGAVISGRMAASSLLSSEGRPGAEIDPGLPPSWLARWLIRY